MKDLTAGAAAWVCGFGFRVFRDLDSSSHPVGLGLIGFIGFIGLMGFMGFMGFRV